MFSDHLK